MHKYGVVLGRFQPFHNGHLALIRNALEHAKNLIVLIGSHESALTAKNPFTASRRQSMIENSLTPSEVERITFRYVHDYLYRERDWVSQVRQTVEQVTGESEDLTLIGHDKDRSSYYLHLFPDWTPTLLPSHADGISATDVRVSIFEGRPSEAEAVVPEGSWDILTRWMGTESFVHAGREYEYIQNYRKAWSVAPYPPTLVTVDTVLTCSDYVLLVKRGGYPGFGLWALPGGFIEQHETIIDAARRELREETGKNSDLQFLSSRVFDHPSRSQLGRVITHAHHYETPHLHDIKAGDDASHAQWFPRHKLKNMRAEFHDDHAHIIDYFLGSF